MRVCIRCGNRHGRDAETCSWGCEHAHEANGSVPHYNGRNNNPALQEALGLAVRPKPKVLLDNDVSLLQAGKTV